MGQLRRRAQHRLGWDGIQVLSGGREQLFGGLVGQHNQAPIAVSPPLTAAGGGGSVTIRFCRPPMNFEQTLFISYAHIDDQPLRPWTEGLDHPVSRDPEGHLEHAHGPRGEDLERREASRAMMFFRARSSLSSSSLPFCCPS